MSHAALDIANAISGPLATAALLAHAALQAPGKAGSGFDGHLQRAGKGGDKSSDNPDDSAKNSQEAAADSSSDRGKVNPKPTRADSRRDPSAAKPSTASEAADRPATNERNEAASSESPSQPPAPTQPDDSNDTPDDPSQAAAAAAQLLASITTVAAPPSLPSPDLSADLQAGDSQNIAQATSNLQPPWFAPTATRSDAFAAPTVSNLPGAVSADASARDSVANSIEVGAVSDAASSATEATSTAAVAVAQPTAADQQPPATISTEVQLSPFSPLPAPGKLTKGTASTSGSGDAATRGGITVAKTSAADRPTAPDEPRGARGQRAIDTAAAVAGLAGQQSSADVPTEPPPQPNSSSDDQSLDRKPAASNSVGGAGPKAASQAPTQAVANTAAQSNKPTPTPGQSSAGSAIGDVDRVRFLQRVSSAFRAADEQGGQIRLRLSPPELGSMKLELTVRDGVMTAHVQAETDTARTMLLDHLPQLRERLADHNIKIDHFDVELMNQSQTGTPQNSSHNPHDGLSPPQAGVRRTPTGEVAGDANPTSTRIRLATAQLDVTI